MAAATAANDAVMKLQAIVNRYASEGGFSALRIDGGMGLNTENAVRDALTVAAFHNFPGQENRTADGDDLAATFQQLDTGSPRQSFIMQNISALITTLDDVANQLGMDPAAVVALVQSSGGTKVVVKAPPNAGPGLSIKIWWRQQSVPIKAGVGVAGVLALVGGYSMIKKKAG